eukprot:CAMPEP_0172660466 /NCGR_PEP_ID=MMETSP1074-20121228/4081_1 /TAXON_ID=2916 /ORGANISM="Ceratium fusus, Strain PA161109" /LENGTH=89 /DNA_ID=CAMNT_0013476085 /DNA_START=635 /DNA_END=904 /DNA_ORIENTATION=+
MRSSSGFHRKHRSQRARVSNHSCSPVERVGNFSGAAALGLVAPALAPAPVVVRAPVNCTVWSKARQPQECMARELASEQALELGMLPPL